MGKHNTQKVKKIKAIPDRRMDFYRRIINSPEQQKRRKNRRIAEGVAFAALLACALIIGLLYYQENQYKKEIASLESFLENEDNITA